MSDTQVCSSTAAGRCSTSPLSQFTSSRPNVGEFERWASLGAGCLLTGLGAGRGKILPSLIGLGLIYRGMTGHCSLYEKLGIDTTENLA